MCVVEAKKESICLHVSSSWIPVKMKSAVTRNGVGMATVDLRASHFSAGAKYCEKVSYVHVDLDSRMQINKSYK